MESLTNYLFPPKGSRLFQREVGSILQNLTLNAQREYVLDLGHIYIRATTEISNFVYGPNGNLPVTERLAKIATLPRRLLVFLRSNLDQNTMFPKTFFWERH